MDEGIRRQYESIRKNWGQAAAERYLNIAIPQQQIVELPKPRRYAHHQGRPQKRFRPLEECLIRSQYQEIRSTRKLAKEWGCSHRIIQHVVSYRGGYARSS